MESKEIRGTGKESFLVVSPVTCVKKLEMPDCEGSSRQENGEVLTMLCCGQSEKAKDAELGSGEARGVW